MKNGWLVLAAVAALVGGCAVGTTGSDESVGTSEEALSPSCELVKCALPLCAQGQHLAYQGSCCATCVGPESRCADVMCKMQACDEGEELVTTPGDCCGRCRKLAPAPACTVDADCPSYACFACPCPVSSCVGRRCVTTTPDAATCSTP